MASIRKTKVGCKTQKTNCWKSKRQGLLKQHKNCVFYVCCSTRTLLQKKASEMVDN